MLKHAICTVIYFYRIVSYFQKYNQYENKIITYIYIISYKTARVVGLTPSLKSHERGLRNSLKLVVCNYNTVCII